MSIANRVLLIVVATAAISGCRGRHSGAGFRLPETGDIAEGQQAFVSLGCHSCHTVDRVDLPAADAEAALIVPLGGAVSEYRTDGFLLTSIIHPSHRIARPRRETSLADGESRMPDLSEKMTVRQLVDLVAFLQSSYRFVPPPTVY